MKSILLGSNGYIGRHLAFHLERAGFDNSNFDIHSETHSEISPYQKFDITNKADFEKLNSDVDYIFLFAGLTGTAVGFDKYKDFIEVNEVGLLNLLTWMREKKCKARVVFPSTRLVYKGSQTEALKEEDPKETKTVYAANKLNAENLLWMYQNSFGIDYTVFRICVPYGNVFDNDFSYGTLGFFMDRARKGEDIILFGDGSLRRTFTHVSDISTMILGIIQEERTKNQVFNIGGENMSLVEVASCVAGKYGVGVTFDEWPDMTCTLESGSTVFDDSKLRSVMPFVAEHALDSWVKELS